jgi:nucleotide-binding universal stress UspA family protein
MSLFNGILVAVDGSDASQRALETAARMAAAQGEPLYLLYVIRDMQFPQALSRMAEVERMVGTRSDVLGFVAQKLLKQAKADARKIGAKTVETMTREGDPASQITATAQEKEVGLIVMGTRGLGSMTGALLGSVSRKVSNIAEQHVLIVR